MRNSHAWIALRVAVHLWKTEKLVAEVEHFLRTKQQNPAISTSKPHVNMHYIPFCIPSWQCTASRHSLTHSELVQGDDVVPHLGFSKKKDVQMRFSHSFFSQPPKTN